MIHRFCFAQQRRKPLSYNQKSQLTLILEKQSLELGLRPSLAKQKSFNVKNFYKPSNFGLDILLGQFQKLDFSKILSLSRVFPGTFLIFPLNFHRSLSFKLKKLND